MLVDIPYCAIDQKCIRVTISEQNLAYFNRNLKEFLPRFVTMDETWIHDYTPESRKGLRQWVKPTDLYSTLDAQCQWESPQSRVPN